MLWELREERKKEGGTRSGPISIYHSSLPLNAYFHGVRQMLAVYESLRLPFLMGQGWAVRLEMRGRSNALE